MTFVVEARARGDDGGVPTLAAADFTLTVSRVDEDGGTTALTADELATYFSVARCACPTSVVAALTLGATAAAGLGTQAVEAQLMVGNDCDAASATGCVAVGSALTLSAQKRVSSASVATSAIFAATSRAGCAAASTTSTRLWAVVRLEGARLSTQPSVSLTVGGAGPKAPTAVKTLTAENGLLVSWKASDDASRLRGHQVLCLPGVAKPAEASYDTCPAAAPDGGASPFVSLAPEHVCSGLVAAGTGSVRVAGLENGRVYRIAIVAVGLDGTPSPPSVEAEGTPEPTMGFEELYRQGGGAAEAGCAAASGGATDGPGLAALLAVAVVVAWASRRGRIAVLLVAGGLVLTGAEARAALAGDPSAFTEEPAPVGASPTTWNIELRFGPYVPDVDEEFVARGEPARPFADTFSSTQRLMSQLEIDRQLLRRGGTWSLGLGVGYYRATAAALSSDLKSRTGDQTALRLVPLSAALVYRADTLRTRMRSPLVPYVKAGLDCTFWRASDTSKASVDGRTFGWHGAAGVTLDLASLDPEAARAMDIEAGVNQTALFFEVARYRLDGFGSRSALHVGDTTWFAGFMFEL